MALARLDKHQDALDEFELLLKTEPNNGVVLRNRGLSHLALGHYELAAADCQRAAELDPADITAVALLARTCAAQGRLDDASVFSQKLMAATPANVVFEYRNAIVLMLLGPTRARLDARKQVVPKLLARSEPNLAYVGSQLAMLAPIDPKLAAAALARMEEVDNPPGKIPILGPTIAALQIRLGQLDAAATRLETFDFAKAEGVQLAMYQLCQAELFAARGDRDAAAKYLQACSPWFQENCPGALTRVIRKLWQTIG